MAKAAPRILTPGVETPADPVDSEANAPGEDGGEAVDADTELAALQLENAQLRAALAEVNAQLAERQEAKPKEPRIIGEGWSTKTSAEAHAAGVTKTVLCSDGYYVPGR